MYLYTTVRVYNSPSNICIGKFLQVSLSECYFIDIFCCSSISVSTVNSNLHYEINYEWMNEWMNEWMTLKCFEESKNGPTKKCQDDRFFV